MINTGARNTRISERSGKRSVKMRRKNLFRMIFGFTMAAVLILSIPLASSCAAPGPTPEPTPEPTPTPEPIPEPATDLPTYDLKMPTIYGPAQVRDFCQPTVDDIYAASDGRIKIRVFASGELMPDDQGLAALDSGTIDFLWGIGPNVATPIDLIDFDCFPPFAWDSSMDLWSMY